MSLFCFLENKRIVATSFSHLFTFSYFKKSPHIKTQSTKDCVHIRSASFMWDNSFEVLFQKHCKQSARWPVHIKKVTFNKSTAGDHSEGTKWARLQLLCCLLIQGHMRRSSWAPLHERKFLSQSEWMWCDVDVASNSLINRPVIKTDWLGVWHHRNATEYHDINKEVVYLQQQGKEKTVTIPMSLYYQKKTWNTDMGCRLG